MNTGGRPLSLHAAATTEFRVCAERLVESFLPTVTVVPFDDFRLRRDTLGASLRLSGEHFDAGVNVAADPELLSVWRSQLVPGAANRAELADWAAELANELGGRFKRSLSRSGLRTRLELPVPVAAASSVNPAPVCWWGVWTAFGPVHVGLSCTLDPRLVELAPVELLGGDGELILLCG